MKYWWCMECQTEVQLDKHGRCETCESEAVDLLPKEGESANTISTAAMEADSRQARA